MVSAPEITCTHTPLSVLLMRYTVEFRCNRGSGESSPPSRWCVMRSSRNLIAVLYFPPARVDGLHTYLCYSVIMQYSLGRLNSSTPHMFTKFPLDHITQHLFEVFQAVELGSL